MGFRLALLVHPNNACAQMTLKHGENKEVRDDPQASGMPVAIVSFCRGSRINFRGLGLESKCSGSRVAG